MAFRFLVLCAGFLFALGASADAHNLPYSLASAHFTADGHYEIDIECHVAALIVGLPQAHLTTQQQHEFAALPDGDITARVTVMADYLRQTVEIGVDGMRVETPTPVFPTIAEIRADARMTLADQRPSAPIRMTGALPANAHEVVLSFPGVLGSVVLRLEDPRGKTALQALVLNELSQPFVLRARPTARAAPVWFVTTWQYLRLGATHILTGLDHLVFVLGLLLIAKDRWTLLKTITAFTLAHSITLAVATLGGVGFSRPLLNFLIALSILALAPEVIRARAGATSLFIRHPWVIAFAFGLLHGFGFASGLTALGLPRSELPLALVLFNVGVELGQLVFITIVLGLARAFRLMEITWPRPVAAAPAYAVAALGLFWTVQYGIQFFA